eukprot:11196692-Lingulodinium_polyedra.AAC.1
MSPVAAIMLSRVKGDGKVSTAVAVPDASTAVAEVAGPSPVGDTTDSSAAGGGTDSRAIPYNRASPNFAA